MYLHVGHLLGHNAVRDSFLMQLGRMACLLFGDPG